MNLDLMIKTVVGPLLTGGCHNRVNLSDKRLPYAVFHEVEGEPVTGISSSYLGKTRCEYEIVIYAQSPEAAKGIALGPVFDAITESVAIQGVLTFQAAGPYIEEDNNFQYITQYEIWHEG